MKERQAVYVFSLLICGVTYFHQFINQAKSKIQGLILDKEENLLLEAITSAFNTSKYEQKVTEVPVMISIVTADKTQHYHHHNPFDIIHNARG